MKILNLLSGIGGNRKLWEDQHEITAIEHNQQIAMIYYKRFPNDKVIVGDAYDYCLKNYDKFDFIWASPPCQTHSHTNHFLHAQGVRRYPDLKLWQIIIFLKEFCKKYWLVENVKPYYEDHIRPNFILGRHYFWSNIPIPNEGFKFSKTTVLNAKSSYRRSNQEYYQDLCDLHLIDKKLIDFLRDKRWPNHDLKGQVLRNCLEPKIGKYILESIKKQTTLEIYNR